MIVKTGFVTSTCNIQKKIEVLIIEPEEPGWAFWCHFKAGVLNLFDVGAQILQAKVAQGPFKY